VAKSISRLLAQNRGSTVVFVDPLRRNLPLFEQELHTLGLQVEILRESTKRDSSTSCVRERVGESMCACLGIDDPTLRVQNGYHNHLPPPHTHTYALNKNSFFKKKIVLEK